MIRSNNILQTKNTKINSLIKRAIILCIALLMFCSEGLFAQVISNSGATISVAGAVVNSKDFENSSGTLGNNGTINLSGNFLNANPGFTNGNGFYNLNGNWTNYGSFNAGTSIVTLQGIVNQTITHGSSGETFYILTINNPGRIVTQVANAGSTLAILNNLNLTAGTLSLGPSTLNLIVGGKATIGGSLTFDSSTPQTSSIAGILSGSGSIDMSGGSLPHLLNLTGSTNAIGTFTTSPAGSSTVNYNGTTQTVFSSPNYRNLIISNSGIKTLQGSSLVGLTLDIKGGTVFDLGTITSTLDVAGNTLVGGTLSFNGGSAGKTVSLTGDLTGTGGVDMSGGALPHLLNLSGATNTLGSFTTSPAGSSTVNYRNGNQIVILTDNYRNIITSGGGIKTLNGDISASGVLTMTSGDIQVNSNTLKLTNGAPGAIVRTTGTVVGKLQRAIGTKNEFLFPVGTLASYNPLKLNFQDLTSPGPLTAVFKPAPIIIGPLPVPLDDNGNEIYDTYSTGYWSLTSGISLATADFNVNANFNGFPGVDNSASIIKRTNSVFSLDGVHDTVDLVKSEIARKTLVEGISTNTTDFAIGKGRPRIIDQPKNIDICELSNAYFEVKARGRGTLTYQWQVSINFVGPFNDISDGGVYSGATTKKLILTGVPYIMNGYVYRCIITDNQGHPNTTNQVLLTVNKIPIATATPAAQDECPGVAFTNIVLGTNNNVTGTTFKWTRDNPVGITTNLPSSGTATGDQINGIFTDTLNAPVTITFTITPTGPGTTFCIGQDITVTVTVNPKPRVLGIPATSLQCDSMTTNIQLRSSSTFTSGLVSFKYTVTTTGAITGYASPTSGLANNSFITDKLINQTDGYKIVTYRVVPVSPVGCLDGDAQNVIVTVNPTPRVVPVNSQPAMCSDGTTRIILTSPTLMASGYGIMRFDYTVSVSGGAGDVVGPTGSVINLSPGDLIKLVYKNNSNIIQSVYYSITPRVDNASCLPGKKVTTEVKIHPLPLPRLPVSIDVPIPLTCSGGTGQAGLATLEAIISIGAGPYQIIWKGPVGYQRVDSVKIANLSSGKYFVKVTDNLGCFRKDSIQIDPVTAHPYIAASPINNGGNYNISCIGSTDGTILVSVSSGITPPYTWRVLKNDVTEIGSGIFTNNLNLLDPATFSYYTGLGAGTYTLIIRDINNCVNSNKITFRVPPPMVVVFGKPALRTGGYDISCKGYSDGSVWAQSTTGGRGGFTYRWFTYNGNIPGSVNTSRIDNITAGEYFLETKDVLGCIKIDSVMLTEPAGMQLSSDILSLSPDGNFNISCNGGNDGTIGLNIAGGSGIYIFAWTGPNSFTAITKDISGLKAGVYTCTVRDQNGCILTPSPTYTLTEPAAMAINSTTSTSNDGGYSINCNGGTGAINISVTGGSAGNYTYVWSTTNGSGIVAGQKNQSALTVGIYHLVVKDLNNCVITKDITLTQPPSFGSQLSVTNITCQSPGFNNGSIDLTVSGGVAPYSYSWSNGATSEDVAGLTEGYYQVNITYNNTCTKSDSVRVNLPPPLNYAKTLSDFNGYNITCYGQADGKIEINPTSGLTPFVYTWTGPDGFMATTKDISELKTGEYILSITDSNYCIISDTIIFTEPDRLGLTFNLSASVAGGFNINCAGDSTGSITIEPLNQVNTVEYIWSDGGFGKTRVNLPAGDYNVIITDANNCHASSAMTLIEPDSIKLNFDITQPFCPDKPDGEIRLNVTGGVIGTDYSYIWSDNSSDRNVSNILRGLFKVTVGDLNGCSVKDSVKLEPVNKTCLIIPNAISPNEDLINDVWNIGLIELYPRMEIKIFNRWGETLWRSEKGYPKPWDGKSNGTELPIDSYHYIIDLHNGSKPIVGNVTIVK